MLCYTETEKKLRRETQVDSFYAVNCINKIIELHDKQGDDETKI